jgi:hypothetical protein
MRTPTFEMRGAYLGSLEQRKRTRVRWKLPVDSSQQDSGHMEREVSGSLHNFSTFS